MSFNPIDIEEIRAIAREEIAMDEQRRIESGDCTPCRPCPCCQRTAPGVVPLPPAPGVIHYRDGGA